MNKRRISSFTALLKTGEAFLLNNYSHLFYLTGYEGDAGFGIALDDKLTLFVDFRFVEQAKDETKCQVIDYKNQILTSVTKFLHQKKVSKLFFDVSMVSYGSYLEWQKYLASSNIEFLPGEDGILQLRAVKDSEELVNIERAAIIADKGYFYLKSIIKAGITEKELARRLDGFMLEQGAEKLAFPTILAFGGHGALPHAVPSGRVLKENEFIIADFGCQVQGYCSDMTRTLYLGEADIEAKYYYDTVMEAQQAALAIIKAGAICKDVDNASRSVIAKQGLAEFFGHGLGHGVGVEVHEEPKLNSTSDTVLMEQMVVTVEPGIYLPEKFGIRIEDLVVVTKQGYRSLSEAPKDEWEIKVV
ncbi:MAG: aminopeptidase P family protein [Clostridia bacterium]